jgi:hypothetical protein
VIRHAGIALLLGCSPSTPPVDAGDDSSSAMDSPVQSDVATEAAGDTWVSYAQGFFQTYCDTCHMAGSSLEPSMPSSLYFTSQSNVVNARFTIRCGVCATQDPTWSCPASPVAKQFPIGSGPFPSDADRNRIVAWLTAGAP